MSEQLTLESLHRRLNEFRKNRQSIKARIPEEIWLDACILCEKQKPYLVAKTLGLKCDALKKRLQALSGEVCEKKQTAPKSAGFVDLGRLDSAHGQDISLRLETVAGIKIHLQCSKFELTAVASFVHTLSGSAV